MTVAGKKATPKVGLELPDDSKVKPAKTAVAQVMLLDGSIISVAGGETFVVGPKSDPNKKRTTIEGIQIAMNEVAKTGRGPTVQGMVKMGQPNVRDPNRKMLGAATMGIEGLSPVNTAIEPSDTITFRWSPTTKIDWQSPLLAIRDENKTTIFVESIAAGVSSVTIPWAKMGLKTGGSYKWHLGYKDGETIVVKGNHFPFQIVSDRNQQTLAADLATVERIGLESSAGKNLLRAQVYYKHGLYHQTVSTLAPLSGKSGAAVKHLLYVSYRRMGLIKDMRKYE
ncbi:MAG: DUF928 domain-containing protein [Deltaproteobacteria bacterium]|nr:DUF928 domain-containing protein [Deltaproteobacteria bacterium]